MILPPRAKGSSELSTLPGVVWGLGVVSLLTDVAADMVYPLLPALLAGLGGTALTLGLMEGIAEACSALLKVWSGHMSDRGPNARRYVIAGYGLAAVSRPLMAFMSHPAGIIVLRALDRSGKGIRSAPRDVLLASAVPERQRGLAFGVHRALDNLGAVLGGATSFILIGYFGLGVESVLIASLIPGLASTLVAVLATRPRADRAPAPEIEAPTRASSAELGKPVRLLLVSTGLFALGASADSFLLAHLAKLGLPLAWLPLAWITLQLGKSVLNIPGGALADRLGPKKVLVASFLVYALSYAAFASVSSPWTLWTLLGLYAFHYGLGEGAEKALLVRLAPIESRGRALGWQHAIHGAALLPANLAFGYLYTLEPTWAFAFSGIMATVGALVLAVGVGGATQPPERAASA